MLRRHNCCLLTYLYIERWPEQARYPFWNRPNCRAPTKNDRTGWSSFRGNEQRASHGCHRHRHRRRLIPPSSIDEGLWCCTECHHQEGGQVRWSSTNVHVRPAGVRNALTYNVKGVEFFQELGRCLTVTSDDNLQTSLLFQRISITLQRFNAITFADTFSQTPELETVF